MIDLKKIDNQIFQKYSYDISETFARVVKDDNADRIEIEVGDAKQPDFKPQIKIKRWDNEVNFSMRAIEHGDAVVEAEGDVIKYKTPDYEVHQYEVQTDEIGGFEFEWVLPNKPSSNVLTATIQTKELDFFYQPELTQEEIDEGAFRPENVIGSYAVYHKTKKNNIVGGKEYKTGKAFHIFRPKAIDANGAETWCELNVDVDNGILTVTVPQKFLDTAVYPVVVDPTFGYDSPGASITTVGYRTNSTSGFGQLRAGRKFNLSSQGNCNSISCYLSEDSGGTESIDVSLFVNREDSEGTGSHGEVVGIESVDVPLDGTSAQLVTINSSDELLSIDDYILSVLVNGASISWDGTGTDSVYIHYDNTSSGNRYLKNFTSAGYEAGKEDPWTSTAAASDNTYSIYATYTASGGSPSASVSPSSSVSPSASVSPSSSSSPSTSPSASVSPSSSVSPSVSPSASISPSASVSRSVSPSSSISSSPSVSVSPSSSQSLSVSPSSSVSPSPSPSAGSVQYVQDVTLRTTGSPSSSVSPSVSPSPSASISPSSSVSISESPSQSQSISPSSSVSLSVSPSPSRSVSPSSSVSLSVSPSSSVSASSSSSTSLSISPSSSLSPSASQSPSSSTSPSLSPSSSASPSGSFSPSSSVSPSPSQSAEYMWKYTTRGTTYPEYKYSERNTPYRE